jgi:hypothetical protein
MTQRRPYSGRRGTARRLPHLEHTGAFTLACMAVLATKRSLGSDRASQPGGAWRVFESFEYSERHLASGGWILNRQS